MLAATLKAFASHTSMHGIKYVVDERKSPRERKFWAIIITLSIVGCIYMITVLWNDFISKPTRVYTMTNQASTAVIPFPALTICDTNTISKTKVKKFVKKLNLFNEDRVAVEKAFEVLLAFRFKLQLKYQKKDIDLLQRVLTKTSYTISEVIANVSRRCDEILVKCSWLGTVVKCNKIFEQSLSSSGYCCSFNYNIESISKIRSSRENVTPRYISYPGFTMGLSVLLNSHKETEKISHRLTNGMEAIIHYNDVYPGTRAYRKILSSGLQTFLQISGSNLEVSKEVAMLSIEERGCIFSAERELNFFKVYTQTNCYLECEIFFIFSSCDCVPYFYNFGNYPVCDLSKIPCLFNIRYRNYSKLECNCPTKCAYINYDVTSSAARLVKPEVSTWSFMTNTNITEDSILVTAFFTSQAQEIHKRDVVDSTIYLLASFGGIFGLFLGWSLITGIEIIYYFIFRIIFKRKLKNSTKKLFWKKMREKRPPFTIYKPREYLP